MFMELYYKNYREHSKGEYRNEPISLPFAILIPDPERRREFERMLLSDGFQCVVAENEYPYMYVNFTLKRYGRNVKACRSNSINKEAMTEQKFLRKVYRYWKRSIWVRKMLEDNYALSARIQLRDTKCTLANNIRNGAVSECYTRWAMNEIYRLDPNWRGEKRMRMRLQYISVKEQGKG